MEAFCQIPLESTGDRDCHIKRQRFLLRTSHIVVLTILQLRSGEDLGTLRKRRQSLSSKTISSQKWHVKSGGTSVAPLTYFWVSPLRMVPLCLTISSSPPSTVPHADPSQSSSRDKRAWHSGGGDGQVPKDNTACWWETITRKQGPTRLAR